MTIKEVKFLEMVSVMPTSALFLPPFFLIDKRTVFPGKFQKAFSQLQEELSWI